MEEPRVFIRVPYMNPYILGLQGQGLLVSTWRFMGSYKGSFKGPFKGIYRDSVRV